MKTPYFEGDKLTAGELEWIIDAIHHAATNGLAEEDLPNLPPELQDGTSDPLGRNFTSAAWCLREIAHAAIDRLDRLPTDAQRDVCSQSEAWPFLIRPKVSTSAKRAGIRVAALGLGTKLPINLDHSTTSESGEKVPVGESIWPGIGLARRLYEVLREARISEGLDQSSFVGYPSALVCAADPGSLADSLEVGDGEDGSGEGDKGGDQGRVGGPAGDVGAGPWIQAEIESEPGPRRRTRVGRTLHRQILIATLPDLTPETAGHWALAGLRHLQSENGGFLVHDICSDKSRAAEVEKLSPWIPKDYWSDKKVQAAADKDGRSAIPLLENEVFKDLKRGFATLAERPGA